jgi:hypothetical protein
MDDAIGAAEALAGRDESSISAECGEREPVEHEAETVG